MRTSLRSIAVGVVAAAAMTVTACSSGTSSSPATSSPATSTGSLSAQAQKAAAVVAAAGGAHNAFESPGPAITGTKALSGKVVYYVAASIEVPLFKQISDSLTAALATVGVQVRVCDAQGNPQGAASCLGQAVNAHAAAVVAGGFPDQFAPVAFKAVRDAGIPLLYTMVTPAATANPTRVSYISPDYFALESLNANWVIADSDAKAHVLVVEATDNANLIAWVEQGALATYKADCSGCTVKVVDTNAAQLDKLPSLVTSALVADPAIDYVQVAFDDRVQATLQGIQASGRTNLKVISEDGTLSVMQSLAKANMLTAETGFDTQAFSWYAADRLLRMMAGQAAPNYTFPITRIFSRATASKLTLTPAAQVSGIWYGNADYRSALERLWGVQ
jgi:ribose transport system substrate-binding protein